jgi:hypothetical protein
VFADIGPGRGFYRFGEYDPSKIILKENKVFNNYQGAALERQFRCAPLPRVSLVD